MMNMTIEQIETLVDAVRHYGEIHQQVKAMEEAGELIQAIARIMSVDIPVDNQLAREKYEANLCEEISDMEIMLEQLKIIYRLHDRVATWRTLKLGRLRNRIDREEGRKSDG